MPKRDLIIASNNSELHRNLRRSLAGSNWQIREALGGAEACGFLEERAPHAMIIDSWLPDLETSFFKAYVQQTFPNVNLLEIGSCVEAFPSFAEKSELLRALRDAEELQGDSRDRTQPTLRPLQTVDDCKLYSGTGALRTELGSLPSARADTNAWTPAIPELVGASATMQELSRLIRLVAPHNARVLIEGETGTGKELVAQALHRLSNRADKPLVTLNCAAIPETLLESELFGYTRGAFTGASQSRIGRIEAADHGTLFLDEVGELSLPLQAKVLRFLENGELQRIGQNEVKTVDVRVIAATHRNLDSKVDDGSFRLDLLHRLSVFPIEVPALRDRKEDIPSLAQSLLSRSGHAHQIDNEALGLLMQHLWPGNVRELAHVLERGVILADGRAELLSRDIRMRKSVRS